eukprot:68332-Rhodomonas_salina.1
MSPMQATIMLIGKSTSPTSPNQKRNVVKLQSSPVSSSQTDPQASATSQVLMTIEQMEKAT